MTHTAALPKCDMYATLSSFSHNPPHFGKSYPAEVIEMSKKYSSLDALLNENAEALAYWQDLPEYVRSQIRTRGQAVNSFESLANYADNLTRGEG